MIDDFIAYWAEPNKSNTKFRYELEKTWDLSMRLERWNKNQKVEEKQTAIIKKL
jgi:hypothetical protein